MSSDRGTRPGASSALVAAAALLAACGPPPQAPSGFETDFEDYLKRPHARAFAIAEAKGDTGPSFGMAAERNAVLDAMDRAVARCEEVQKRFKETLPCRVWFIGDIDVHDMTPEELKAAIAVYRVNPSATNDDL